MIELIEAKIVICDVLIDLKAKSVDRLYSYSIPEHFLSVIEVGMRVFVEFGNMKRMGFVVGLRDSESTIKLKPIIELIDINPVVTKELIDLSFELSKTSYYPVISYLLTMIPQSLKVTYKKKLKLIDKENTMLNLIFDNKDVIDFESVNKDSLKYIKESIKNGSVELIYDYDTKESIKIEKRISVVDDSITLTEKRKQIVDYIRENNNDCSWITLRDSLNVSYDTIKRMVDKGIVEVREVEIYRDIIPLKPFKDKKVVLNSDQEKVLETLKSSLGTSDTYLLKGVTGSGKTEVYLSLIEEVLRMGKEAIVLVPEISLTPMMVNRFKSRFKDLVAIFHSELSNNTRYDEWRKVLKGDAKIAVGARSAIFTPFKNLGLIIIDEEHELSYKQDNSPIYHAKDVALRRCKNNNALLLLGSATPSVESYTYSKNGFYKLLELNRRANKMDLPKSVLVDLNEEVKKGNNGYISKRLKDEIEKRLINHEQSILLLNRRGYSQFVMCRSCGAVEMCPNCDTSLTYHEYDKSLKCHYCGYEKKFESKCSICGSTLLEKVGNGTERVEEELKELFPSARIVRMDNDTVKGKNGHERVLNEFEFNGDILLGTQMIAKGLDYPNVTLVGVINASQTLKLPTFRSKEETFNLLTQVSGRCGRGEKEGLVVVQTYDLNHYAIKYGISQDYEGFYNEEIALRRMAKFIPFYNMINIKVKAKDMGLSFKEALKIKELIERKLKGNDVLILGPIKPTIQRIDSLYIYNLILKYKSAKDINDVIKEIFESEVSDDFYLSIDRFPQEL